MFKLEVGVHHLKIILFMSAKAEKIISDIVLKTLTFS